MVNKVNEYIKEIRMNQNHLFFEVKVDGDGFTVRSLFIKPFSLAHSLGFDFTISASSLNHPLLPSPLLSAAGDPGADR